MIARAAALAALLPLAACIDGLAPDVGPPNRAVCTPGDSDPTTDVHFGATLHDGIFKRDTIGCLNCHTPGGETPIGLEIGGLDLTDYDTLRAGGSTSGASIVVPGDPCASILVQKVSDSPPFGARMPLNQAALSDADRQAIHDWIAEGAHDD